MNLIEQHEREHNIKLEIVSFDVFDTVLTRITADPAGIFFKMQHKLSSLPLALPEQLSGNFASVRRSAERAARRIKRSEEVSFHEIYRIIGRQFGLTDDVIKRLMALEIDIEIESVHSIPINYRRIDQLRLEGKKIVFVSDMYLPKSVIQNMLEKIGVLREHDVIYVSSESGLTKSSGNLYRSVLELEKCSPRHILHIGDNRRSDYHKARRVGKILAHHFADSHFTRSEQILRKSSVKGHELTWQLIAGASRIARLQAQIQSDVHRQNLFTVGANLAGPILWGFVSWVLKESIHRKIRRLYFVARDGQILYEIAARLCSDAGYPIELRYLYGSRQAWHLPGLNGITSSDLHWITVKDPFLSLRVVASRLNLEPVFLAAQLCNDGLVIENPDKELSSRDIARLKQVLLHSTRLQDLILVQSEKSLQAVSGYLYQEGLCDDIDWALVDSGWNGRLQNSLSSILKKMGRDGNLFGFYLGLLSPVTPVGSKEGYLFSTQAPVSHRSLGASLIYLLELIMSADHGITRSYSLDRNGRWIPELSDPGKEMFMTMGGEALREGINAFIDHLDPSLINLDHAQFRERAVHLLRDFHADPPQSLAVSLGRIPYATDQAGRNFLKFAPPMSFCDAVLYILKLAGREKFLMTYWLHGSRKQSAQPTRLFLAAVGTVLSTIGYLNTAFVALRQEIRKRME